MKLNRILLSCYKFDIKKEFAHYIYLCGERLTRKEAKLISSTNIRYQRYLPWKEHIIQKFQNYSKKELIELSRLLNQLFRNSDSFKTYTQNIWMVIFPSLLSLIVSSLISIWTPENTFLIQIFSIIVFVPILVYILKLIYDNYTSGGLTAYFYDDVKAIVDEMIENYDS